MKVMSQPELIAELQRKVDNSSQKAVADELGLSYQMLNDLIRGRRDVSDRIARLLGFQRQVVFRKIA